MTGLAATYLEEIREYLHRYSGSVAHTLPAPYGDRFNTHGSEGYKAFQLTRVTFSLNARMTIPGFGDVNDVDDDVFAQAVAADLGFGVDTVAVVSKAVSSRRQFRSSL